MKVVVVVKKGLGGSGISQATRYISTRERDEAREGLEARKLFSESEERLTYTEANRLLGKGSEPRTDNLLHLVISFHQEADFQQLGTAETERLKGVRDATRDTLQEMTNALNAKSLRWVAGIHRNTDHPHVHLLIHREYTDRETGRTKHLHTLPKEMRVSWEKAADGSRIINPGLFSQTFAKHCEQTIRQRKEADTRQLQETTRERLQLGQALLAEERIQQLQQSLQSAIHWGEWRRYPVVDAQGRGRSLSEFDLEQRAAFRAQQIASQMKFDAPAERRYSLQQAAVIQEGYKYEGIAERIRQARANDRSAIEQKLQQTLSTSLPLLEAAKRMREKYEQAELPIPIPTLSRADLAQLQHRAIFYGDAKKLKDLEAIRVALAAEKGEPVRTETEVARLQAQLFLARSSLRVEQQTAARMEETKHLRQWKVGGGGRDINTSLASLDAALAYASDQAKFIGSRRLHWDADKRSEAGKRAEELAYHRVTILNRIVEERAKLTAEIARRTELVQSLNEIYVGERQRYQQEGRPLPRPLFTLQDLRELESHAARRHEPQFYQTLVKIERHVAARSQRQPQEVAREQYSRAIAREIIAGVKVRESAARMERYETTRNKTMVIVQETGNDITLARLAEVEPKSPLESLFRPFLVRREKYRAIERAVSTYGARIRLQHEQNQAIHSVLSATAQAYAQEFVRANPEQPLPRPQFTARELQQLELQIIKERDPVQREQYAHLYREAIEETPLPFSRPILLNQTEAREILGLPETATFSREAREQGEMNFTR